MDTILIKAIIFITLALVFYTIGVWSEKKQGTLKPWHLALFILGLICDSLGTSYMGQIAGGFSLTLHGITGALALILMLAHAIWAALTLISGTDESKQNFHKFSIIVWAIWLVPYFLGMFLGMA